MMAKDTQEKYKNWSKILIEPNALNVARLYALEARILDEENVRLKETLFMQENLKKLVYSLDQLNSSKITFSMKDSKNNHISNLM